MLGAHCALRGIPPPRRSSPPPPWLLYTRDTKICAGLRRANARWVADEWSTCAEQRAHVDPQRCDANPPPPPRNPTPPSPTEGPHPAAPAVTSDIETVVASKVIDRGGGCSRTTARRSRRSRRTCRACSACAPTSTRRRRSTPPSRPRCARAPAPLGPRAPSPHRLPPPLPRCSGTSTK